MWHKAIFNTYRVCWWFLYVQLFEYRPTYLPFAQHRSFCIRSGFLHKDTHPLTKMICNVNLIKWFIIYTGLILLLNMIWKFQYYYNSYSIFSEISRFVSRISRKSVSKSSFIPFVEINIFLIFVYLEVTKHQKTMYPRRA